MKACGIVVEYNPLHNGHFHCMKTAKDMFPDSLFVAVVPGLFERSGRGIPYILPREVRAEIAISVGADIVVEGPPMGIMGSGQYSLCLCKTFKAMNTDFIPRGYKPVEGMDEILVTAEYSFVLPTLFRYTFAESIFISENQFPVIPAVYLLSVSEPVVSKFRP